MVAGPGDVDGGTGGVKVVEQGRGDCCKASVRDGGGGWRELSTGVKAAAEGGRRGRERWGDGVFFSFLRTAKRSQPTKDKGKETKNRTKTGAPTSAHSGGLNTKARGLPPVPTPPHAPPPGRWGGRQRKNKLGLRTKRQVTGKPTK